jgi:hypothetical protein
MFTGTLISNTIKYVDNLDPTVGSHTVARARYLMFAQEGINDLWYRRNWTFRKAATNGSVTISAAARSGVLPADFMAIGRDGRVLLSGVPLDWVPPGEMQTIQENGSSAAVPECYSIFGMDTTTTSDVARYLIQVPVAGSAYTLEIHGYTKLPPTLVDATTASLLETIPDPYALSYMTAYMRYRGFEDKNDKRAALWLDRSEAVIREMVKTDKQGHDTPQRLAGFFGPWENMA